MPREGRLFLGFFFLIVVPAFCFYMVRFKYLWTRTQHLIAWLGATVEAGKDCFLVLPWFRGTYDDWNTLHLLGTKKQLEAVQFDKVRHFEHLLMISMESPKSPGGSPKAPKASKETEGN